MYQVPLHRRTGSVKVAMLVGAMTCLIAVGTALAAGRQPGQQHTAQPHPRVAIQLSPQPTARTTLQPTVTTSPSPSTSPSPTTGHHTTPPPQHPVSVPEVVGESRSAASAAITAAHLKVSYTLVHSTEPKDLVVSTDPAAGTSVAAGSTVVARISLADEGTVPDVNGLTSQDSYNVLATNGFTNITSTYTAASSSSQDNTVVSQSVAPGTIARHTTPITVTIAIAPQVTSLTITNVSPQCSDTGCTLVIDYTVQTNVPTSVTAYFNGGVLDANCVQYPLSTSDGPVSAGAHETFASIGASSISEWSVQLTTSPSGPGQPVSSSGGTCGPTSALPRIDLSLVRG